MAKRLWFKARPYGWGWYPASREGWTTMGVWLVVVILGAYVSDAFIPSLQIAALTFAGIILVATSMVVYVAAKTGERATWRWGGKEVDPPIVFKRILILAITIGSAELVGIAGSFYTLHALPEWYALLIKPAFAPANWVFAPVWFILYLLMGVALYRIWMRRRDPEARAALLSYVLQLTLNALWVPVFFGFRDISLGFLIILALIIAILLTIVRFMRVDRFAGLLLIPYLVWTMYAAALNAAIWFLN